MAAASSSSGGEAKPPQLLSLKIWKYEKDACVEVFDVENLSSLNFFQRGPAREFIKFHARTVANHTPVGQRVTVKFEGDMGQCHTWVHPQLVACTVLTNMEYPPRVAYTLISEILQLFLQKYPNREFMRATADTGMELSEGTDLFNKFQDPKEADKITKIEKQLDEIKDVVMQSMDDLMKRGETLDSLMKKSNDLSETSYQFYKTAKKNNQCCTAY